MRLTDGWDQKTDSPLTLARSTQATENLDGLGVSTGGCVKGALNCDSPMPPLFYLERTGNKSLVLSTFHMLFSVRTHTLPHSSSLVGTSDILLPSISSSSPSSLIFTSHFAKDLILFIYHKNVSDTHLKGRRSHRIWNKIRNTSSTSDLTLMLPFKGASKNLFREKDTSFCTAIVIHLCNSHRFMSIVGVIQGTGSIFHIASGSTSWVAGRMKWRLQGRVKFLGYSNAQYKFADSKKEITYFSL